MKNHLATGWIGSAMAVVVLAAASGCSKRVPPVDIDRAKTALKTVLEAWQNGDKIDVFQDRSASITAQDFDWQSGHKLIAFELGTEQSTESNLRYPVTLKLVDPEGKPVQRHVTYLISTSPVTTVFREVTM